MEHAPLAPRGAAGQSGARDSAEPASTELEPGTLVAGRYVIESRIGGGGMGSVHRARHRELDFVVAIKVVRPELARDPVVVACLLEEARAMGAIRSDHIVRVNDADRLVDGTPYLVLEFVDGPDLEQVLARRGALSSADTIAFAEDVCRGLSVAHRNGIVHRDIKPENLLLETLGSGAHRIKISDFGIAKRAEGRRAPALTIPSITVGSPYYMAPEQMRNASDIDGRADIWSLGVVLYELVTGHLPFTGASPAEVCARALSMTPISPCAIRATIPARLAHVILRCLERDVSHRYPSVDELARDLGRIVVPAGPESRRLAERDLRTSDPGPAESEESTSTQLGEARVSSAATRAQAASASPLASAAGAPLSLRVDEAPVALAREPAARGRGRASLPGLFVVLATAAVVVAGRGGVPGFPTWPYGVVGDDDAARPRVDAPVVAGASGGRELGALLPRRADPSSVGLEAGEVALTGLREGPGPAALAVARSARPESQRGADTGADTGTARGRRGRGASRVGRPSPRSARSQSELEPLESHDAPGAAEASQPAAVDSPEATHLLTAPLFEESPNAHDPAPRSSEPAPSERAEPEPDARVEPTLVPVVPSEPGTPDERP